MNDNFEKQERIKKFKRVLGVSTEAVRVRE